MPHQRKETKEKKKERQNEKRKKVIQKKRKSKMGKLRKKEKTTKRKKELPPYHPSESPWVQDNFIVEDLIGTGAFGNVYKVISRRDPSKTYAMKQLSGDSKPEFIYTELSILRNLGGVCNILNMHAAYRENEKIFVILDYFEHDEMRDIIDTVTASEILGYMENLILALDYLHMHGIIHHDVKPSNFLYNRQLRQYRLIDFGLCTEDDGDGNSCTEDRSKSSAHTNATGTSISGISFQSKNIGDSESDDSPETDILTLCTCRGLPEVCSPCKKKRFRKVNKSGTPGYRAPEILLRVRKQTSLVDVWSAGITFLSLVCRKCPLMRPSNDFEAIAQYLPLFGTGAFMELADEDGKVFATNMHHYGVDLVKFAYAVQGGFTGELMDVAGCDHCKELFHENFDGKCLCKSSENISISKLSFDERFIFELLRKCLVVNHKLRYNTEMLLGCFADYYRGYNDKATNKEKSYEDMESNGSCSNSTGIFRLFPRD